MKIIKNPLKIIQKRYYPTKQQRIFNDWFNNDGDRKLRLEYPNLNHSSVIFDIGGYKGDFASDIFSKYQPKIVIFEPVQEYYNFICKRFEKNNSIKVENFGLSDRNQIFEIQLQEDSTSIFSRKASTTSKSRYEKITLKDITEYVKLNSISKIDLCKINIEGSEYELMNKIIDSGLIDSIQSIQVQFHDFVDNAKNQRDCIQKRLRKTHINTWNYDFVWENWERIQEAVHER